MSGVARIALALASLATASGADLLSEFAWSGPVGDGRRDILDGVWTATAAGQVAGPERVRGLLVEEDDVSVDGQASIGWARDRAAGDMPGQTRFVARVGSDPLAREDGTAFGGLGIVLVGDLGFGFQGELGRSVERGWTADAEACLSLVRVRLTADDDVTTVRIGAGWRWAGTMDPVAGSILVDYLRSDVRGAGPVEEGAELTGTCFHRAWGHVVVGGQLDVLIGASDPDGGDEILVRGSLLAGVAF